MWDSWSCCWHYGPLPPQRDISPWNETMQSQKRKIWDQHHKSQQRRRRLITNTTREGIILKSFSHFLLPPRGWNVSWLDLQKNVVLLFFAFLFFSLVQLSKSCLCKLAIIYIGRCTTCIKVLAVALHSCHLVLKRYIYGGDVTYCSFGTLAHNVLCNSLHFCFFLFLSSSFSLFVKFFCTKCKKEFLNW